MPAEHPDFWLTSGFHLLKRDRNGRLVVTEDYLRAFLRRPELAPVAESCDAERALHRALLADPLAPVPEASLTALSDPDAADNYRAVLRLRDLLLAHGTLEAAYLAQFRPGPVTVAPLFLDQMAHAILRNILDDCGDPFQARAAELLFRRQKVRAAQDGIMLADEELVEMHAAGAGFGSLGRLLVENDTRPATVDLDLLTEENAPAYWARSDRFDMVLDVIFPRPGLDALCRVLEKWVLHFLGVAVHVQPVRSIRDAHWAWHVGLDGTASGILNDLYEGREIDEDRLAQILALFRLDVRDPAQMLPTVAGRPVYLAMAMDGRKELQLKPQNLLVNLPLAAAA